MPEQRDDLAVGDLPPWVCGALIAAAVVFNLVLLRPELQPVAPLNDGALHYPLIVRAADALGHGESIWDHWNNNWVLGFPVFHYYQHLPHIVVAALARVSGGDPLTIFNIARYLLLAFFPVVIFVALRILTLSRTAATFAAVSASLIAAPALAGFEFESYAWGGAGMYTQIWGMALLPLAVACLDRFARTGRGLAVAAALTGATFVSHVLYAYIVVVSAAVLLLVRSEAPFLRRAWRTAAGLALGVAVVAYFLVPYALTGQWINRSVWEAPTKYDGYGHAWVLWRLVNGELLDAGRIPVLTMLAAIGLAHAMIRRRVADRVVVTLFVAWLLLFFGRPTWGILYRLLPMNADLHIHRFVGGVHFAALALAGLGAEAIVQQARARRQQLAAAAAVLVLLVPAFAERARYLTWNGDLINRNAIALAQAKIETAALFASLRAAQQQQPGRVFAGLPGTWGSTFRVGDLPMYALLSYYGVDTLGFAYHAMSFGADIQYHFDDRNRRHYELFNVTRVIAPPDWQAPPFLQPIERTARWTVYQTPSPGYFSFTPAPPLETTNKAEIYAASTRFVTNLPAFLPAQGEVTTTSTSGGGSFAAGVSVQAPAELMFKMNYHPWWTARVDGSERPIRPIGPAFIGIAMRPGDRNVTLAYAPPAYKSWLVWFGLALLVAMFVWQRPIAGAIDAVPIPRFNLAVTARVNGSLVAVLAIALLAGLPFLQDRVLSGHDSVKYPARLAMFWAALASGDLVPRWAAASSFGYGDPTLNFSPPLTSYVGSAFMALRASPIVAMNLTTLLALVGGAVGYWLIGRRLIGDAAGVVAAAAFAFAPYTLIELYARGDYSEFAGMALVPWLVLAHLRLWQRSSPAALIAAACATAALTLASLAATMVVMPFVAGSLAVAVFAAGDWQAGGRAAAATASGMALSAFSWLPAYVEKSLTHADQMAGGWWEYVNHFVPMRRLVWSPWRFDYNQFPSTGETMPLEIGPVHLVLVGVAIVAVWRARRYLTRAHAFVFSAATASLVVGLLLSTSLSAPLWSIAGPFQYLQFPWRFLIGAAAGATVLSSGAMLFFKKGETTARLAATVIVIVLVAGGLPHARAGAFQQWQPADFSGSRLHQPWLELTTLGEFRPKTAGVAPAAPPNEPARVVSGSASIRESLHAPSHRAFGVNAATASRVEIALLYFPGWTVRIDDAITAVRPSASAGLIEFEVPTGNHHVDARFENTRIRLVANAVSVLAGVGLLAQAWPRGRRRRDSPDRS